MRCRSITVAVLLVACWDLAACGGSNHAATDTSPVPTAPAPTASIVVAGTVRDTGGEPLAGVSVQNGPRQVTTDSSGAFAIATVGPFDPLHFEKEGYERQDRGLVSGLSTLAITLQRQYVLGEAAQLSLTLMPNDNPYYIGEVYESDYCRPCQLIRLRAKAGAKVTLTLQWGASADVAMWQSHGSKCAADGPSRCTLQVQGAAGDIIMYAGLPLENGRVQALQQPLAVELLSGAR